MKKLFVISLLFGIFLFQNVFAATSTKKIIVETVTSSANVSAIPVASTAIVYTKSFSIKQAERLAIMYKATSDGTVGLKIEMEQSYQRPATEGSISATYLVTKELKANLVDKSWNMATDDTLTMMPYARFKITGLSGNDSTTTIQLKVGKQ